ncbi:uncharacterized protein LOC135699237 [Ochlerotatus camptorhynchus]|uniref:uncharacterized protein LOC135699237 n=1 Tax=Ochlerotatus camptorhynchus TaxID=644619 RepID=UPI0031D51550
MEDPADLSHCRLCFSADNLSDAIFPVDGPPDQSLIAMIHDCTSIRISFERDYPCSVCGTCLRVLQQFHGYRQRCLANDRQLRRQRGGEDGDVDPLEECFAMVKQEADDDQQFYRQVKQQIHEFLETKMKEIERTALAKVNEVLRNRDGGIGLQMNVEDDLNNTMDWKSKYLTLQKNNELLQKAFRDQKAKLKQTEQMLRSYQQQSSNVGVACEMMNGLVESQPGSGFTTHPAIPEISSEYLQSLNFNSGAGEKGDRHFVSRLAVAVFGEDILVNSSVTGRPSNSHHNIPPKPPLCSLKMSAIGAKLYERVEQEVGRSNRKELLQRSSEKVVRLVVCQKSMNLRKQVMKRSQSISGGSGSYSLGGGSAGEEEFEEPIGKRMTR